MFVSMIIESFTTKTKYFDQNLMYFIFFLQLLFIFLLGFVLFFLPFMIAKYRKNSLKSTVYECGFDPFQTAKIKFNVQYYMVAILFLIFDLEIVLLFPWAMLLGHLNLFGLLNGCFFLLLLLISLYIEWELGVFTLIAANPEDIASQKVIYYTTGAQVNPISMTAFCFIKFRVLIIFLRTCPTRYILWLGKGYES